MVMLYVFQSSTISRKAGAKLLKIRTWNDQSFNAAFPQEKLSKLSAVLQQKETFF